MNYRVDKMDFFDAARKTDLVGGIKKNRKSSGLFLQDAQMEDGQLRRPS